MLWWSAKCSRPGWAPWHTSSCRCVLNLDNHLDIWQVRPLKGMQAVFERSLEEQLECLPAQCIASLQWASHANGPRLWNHNFMLKLVRQTFTDCQLFWALCQWKLHFHVRTLHSTKLINGIIFVHNGHSPAYNIQKPLLSYRKWVLFCNNRMVPMPAADAEAMFAWSCKQSLKAITLHHQCG